MEGVAYGLLGLAGLITVAMVIAVLLMPFKARRIFTVPESESATQVRQARLLFRSLQAPALNPSADMTMLSSLHQERVVQFLKDTEKWGPST